MVLKFAKIQCELNSDLRQFSLRAERFRKTKKKFANMRYSVLESALQTFE